MSMLGELMYTFVNECRNIITLDNWLFDFPKVNTSRLPFLECLQKIELEQVMVGMCAHIKVPLCHHRLQLFLWCQEMGMNRNTFKGKQSIIINMTRFLSFLKFYVMLVLRCKN